MKPALHSFQNPIDTTRGGTKMLTGTQTQTVWALGIRDLDEMLETCLDKVKHQGELKQWHPEPLSRGRLLHITIHWKNRWAATPTLLLPCCRLPASPLDHHPTRLPPHRLTRPLPTTGGLQHHQTLTPNMSKRCRKTGLDAKGVTPELLRLKFYCSWTRDFFFFLFSLSFCLSCLLFVHHLSL
jgi:hypothetical protein